MRIILDDITEQLHVRDETANETRMTSNDMLKKDVMDLVGAKIVSHIVSLGNIIEDSIVDPTDHVQFHLTETFRHDNEYTRGGEHNQNLQLSVMLHQHLLLLIFQT